MALNTRQADFLNEIIQASDEVQSVYKKIKELEQHFAEEFATAQDNALDDAGVTTDLAAMGLTYAVIGSAINQGFTGLINFWEGNAVTTREYGKDIRRIG